MVGFSDIWGYMHGWNGVVFQWVLLMLVHAQRDN